MVNQVFSHRSQPTYSTRSTRPTTHIDKLTLLLAINKYVTQIENIEITSTTVYQIHLKLLMVSLS
jgi:hypothetical protein